MKYFWGLLAGMIVGIGLLAAGLYWNPFAGRSTVSPVAVTSGNLLELNYSLAPADAVAYLNDGQSRMSLHPEGVQELWEPAIEDTSVRVTVLRDPRGQASGIGIKFSTPSERSRLLNAEVLIDSVWHIRLADGGSMMIEQTENHWSWLRDIVVPATIGSGNSWRGSWYGLTTVGPNALGTAVLNGGGALDGVSGEAVEALRASAYSAENGPVDVDGSVTISFGEPEGP